MKGFFKSRRFRQGTMATAISVVVVALIVVVNFVATALTDRYSLTLDLTPTKLFSITDETKEYLSGLDKDGTIYLLDTEESFSSRGEYYLQSIEVLKKYALESSHISIEYVDLVANPAFAQNYPTLPLSSSSILITCGDKVRDVTPSQLYDIQSDQYTGQQSITASKAEQVLTSAVLAVTSDKAINVATITGHNEESVASLTTLLSTNNYLIGQQNILTEEIDPSYTIAIIAAPQRDYDAEELKKLDRFLKNDGQYGKTLLYMASSQQKKGDLPNLDAFLADWGIEIGDGMVLETDSTRYIPQAPYMAMVDYAEDTYSEASQAAQMYFLGAYARPMSLLFESKSSTTTTTLLQFGATAAVADETTETLEPSGPIPYLVMSRSLTYDGTTPLQSQVIACSSTALVEQQFLSNANLANSEYLLDLLANRSGKEEDIRIQSKSIGSQQLNVTAGQAVGLGVVLAVIFPLAVLIFGIVIWARRRHR